MTLKIEFFFETPMILVNPFNSSTYLLKIISHIYSSRDGHRIKKNVPNQEKRMYFLLNTLYYELSTKILE